MKTETHSTGPTAASDIETPTKTINPDVILSPSEKEVSVEFVPKPNRFSWVSNPAKGFGNKVSSSQRALTYALGSNPNQQEEGEWSRTKPVGVRGEQGHDAS